MTFLRFARCSGGTAALGALLWCSPLTLAQDPPPPPAPAIELPAVEVSATASGRRLGDSLDTRTTADGWTAVTSEEGGYRAEFPGRPFKRSPAPNVHMLVYGAGDAAYFTGYAKMGPDVRAMQSTAQILDNVVEGALVESGAAALRDEASERQGYPARTVVMEANGIRFGWQFIAADGVLYQVGQTIDPADTERFETSRFFEGFRIDAALTYPRLARLMDEAGVVYTREDGGYGVVFDFDDKRSHYVYASDEEFLVAGDLITPLFGFVYEGPEPPTGKAAVALLLENGDWDTGQFRMTHDGELYRLMFTVHVPTDVDADVLAELLAFTAERADAAEAAYFGRDAW